MSRRAALLVALVAVPPTVWFVHLSVSYALVPASCSTGTTGWLHLTTLVGVGTIVAAAVGAARLSRSRRLLGPKALVRSRHLDADRPATDDALPRLAVLVAPYFLLLVAMLGLVFLVVDPCA